MKRKAAVIMCAAMIAAMPMSSVNAAESGKHFTAGATTGFFGAESLDVAYNWDGWIMSIYGISENLFRLDASYVPQPWIAESYENVDDLTWKFTIRDGVTFSDGNPVTAEAVKKCFERTYANNDRAGSTLAIASMEADGQVLTIVTETPNPTILNDLCDPLLGIYDAEKEADPELGVSCTGPFVATSFSAMTEVQMEKNENYWGGTPKVDTVDLKIIDDTEALNMALQNGEIDLIARDGSVLVFIEVKYRKTGAYGDPAEAVDYRKQQKICKTADYYRMLRRIPDNQSCRFDVVAIQGREIRVIRNAFPYCFY